jgi:radical SAM protein with 4Fe4S-binding SPASM domain
MRSCPNPFERFEIKVDGDVYCCCEGWLPKRLGNVFEQDLREIWLGEAARAIRESVLDDSFRFCTMCPYLPGPRGPVTTDPPPDNYADRIKTTTSRATSPALAAACATRATSSTVRKSPGSARSS